MAETREIPREQWTTYLSQVEAAQRDSPVEVELAGTSIGDQYLTRNAQLRAISAVGRGAASGTIEIDLGVDGGLDHRILRPAHLYAIQSSTGQVECLDIEDDQQTKTLIRFKEPRGLLSETSPGNG